MRRVPMSAGAVLAVYAACAAPALAQGWASQTLDREGVSISAPGELKEDKGVFTSAGGATYPARVYALDRGKQIFAVTVADLSTAPVEGDAALDLAVAAFAKQGTVAFDIPARSGRTFGRELNLVRGDGGQSMISLYYLEKRLYLAEGKSLPPDAEDGSSEAIRFVESIAFPGPGQGRPGGGGGGGGEGGEGGGGRGGPAPAVEAAPSPQPVSTEPVSVVVRAPAGAETWRWSPSGAGRVEYCWQGARARAASCVVADNPMRGEHMPASQTAPAISAVIPGQAWVAVGGISYFCKRTSYAKNSVTEVTCEDAAKGRLPREAPTAVQATSNNAARFLFPGNRSYFCRNVFPAPDGGDSQTFLSCAVL